MSNPISLGDAIKEFLLEYKHSNKIEASKAASAWPEVMGKNIAAFTLSAKMVGNKLVVQLKSAALRNELMMHRSKIKAALNKYLGSEVIKEVVLK